MTFNPAGSAGEWGRTGGELPPWMAWIVGLGYLAFILTGVVVTIFHVGAFLVTFLPGNPEALRYRCEVAHRQHQPVSDQCEALRPWEPDASR